MVSESLLGCIVIVHTYMYRSYVLVLDPKAGSFLFILCI